MIVALHHQAIAVPDDVLFHGAMVGPGAAAVGGDVGVALLIDAIEAQAPFRGACDERIVQPIPPVGEPPLLGLIDFQPVHLHQAAVFLDGKLVTDVIELRVHIVRRHLQSHTRPRVVDGIATYPIGRVEDGRAVELQSHRPRAIVAPDPVLSAVGNERRAERVRIGASRLAIKEGHRPRRHRAPIRPAPAPSPRRRASFLIGEFGG